MFLQYLHTLLYSAIVQSPQLEAAHKNETKTQLNELSR